MNIVEEPAFSIAFDRYVTYPSEQVRIMVRLEEGRDPLEGRIQIRIPGELALEGLNILSGQIDDDRSLSVREIDGDSQLTWAADLPVEREILTRVRPNAAEGYLDIIATIYDNDDRPVFQSQTRLKVKRMAEAMHFLPEIYHREDLTNRFLMLFESFWKPISRQIDQMDTTFDPYLTPKQFVPWLGSWFGLELDDDLPEARQRDLVDRIISIYPRTGTKRAMVTFLEMYTGGQVEIVEHFDSNFVLGNETRLGYQVALGDHNSPNTFEVYLRIPAKLLPEGENQPIRTERFRRKIVNLIEQFKPAHTSFHLQLEILNEPDSQIRTGFVDQAILEPDKP